MDQIAAETGVSRSTLLFSELLKKGLEQGDVRADIDVERMAEVRTF